MYATKLSPVVVSLAFVLSTWSLQIPVSGNFLLTTGRLAFLLCLFWSVILLSAASALVKRPPHEAQVGALGLIVVSMLALISALYWQELTVAKIIVDPIVAAVMLLVVSAIAQPWDDRSARIFTDCWLVFGAVSACSLGLWILSKIGVSVASMWEVRHFMYEAPGGLNRALNGLLIANIPALAVVTRAVTRGPVLRMIALASCTAFLALTLCAGSRQTGAGALLAIIVLHSVNHWLQVRRGWLTLLGSTYRIVFAMLLLGVLLWCVAAVSEPVSDWLSTRWGVTTAEDLGTFSETPRAITYLAALSAVAEHPWVGLGPGNTASMTGIWVDNGYLFLASEVGAPALIVTVLVLLLALPRLLTRGRGSSLGGLSEMRVLALTTTLVFFGFMNIINDLLFEDFGWVALGLAAAANKASSRRAAGGVPCGA